MAGNPETNLPPRPTMAPRDALASPAALRRFQAQELRRDAERMLNSAEAMEAEAVALEARNAQW